MLAPIKNLAINRGNSCQFVLQLTNKNHEIITLEENAMIYFTVKDNENSQEFIFQKRLGEGITFNSEDNTYLIEILSDDTNNLEYKNYFYDITIIRNQGLESANKKEKTTVLIGDFKIGYVATLNENEVTS